MRFGLLGSILYQFGCFGLACGMTAGFVVSGGYTFHALFYQGLANV